MTSITRDLQTLFDSGSAAGLSDRQLLDRFADRRDPGAETAFEALVRRHGPMVLRVCRSALPDPNDANDAFQATFLVLVRRSESLRRLDAIGGWLYGVASRVAARARVDAARRRTVEGRAALRVAEAVGPEDGENPERDESLRIVQEEVGHLPERYRAVVVLCHWEGLTQEQAAAQLEIPLGTVRSRLARAREILRRRLGRRGVASVAGIAAAGFDLATAGPIPVAVPDAWVAATVKAVSSFTAGAGAGAGPAAAGAVSASAALLARSVVRSFFMMKLKTCAMGLAFVGIGAAGVILAAPDDGQKGSATPRGGSTSRQSAVSAKGIARTKEVHAAKAMPEYVIEPPDTLIVEVLEDLPGRPISGERPVRPDGRISLGFYGEVYVAGMTLAEAKEKIVQHLRGHISDKTLGLTDSDDKPNIEVPVPQSKLRQTDRVFVDIGKVKSKFFYVLGAVLVPGRVPCTGTETVLDALNVAGGLTAQADRTHVVLYRPAPPGASGKSQALPVNVDQIVTGGDPTMNYQLLPGDRLVVPLQKTDGGGRMHEELSPSLTPHETDDAVARRRIEGKVRPERSQTGRLSLLQDTPDGPTLRDIERRLDVLERKLDRVLEALEDRSRGTSE